MCSDANTISIYRKRLIPDECILLKDDIILEMSDAMIIGRGNSANDIK